MDTKMTIELDVEDGRGIQITIEPNARKFYLQDALRVSNFVTQVTDKFIDELTADKDKRTFLHDMVKSNLCGDGTYQMPILPGKDKGGGSKGEPEKTKGEGD